MKPLGKNRWPYNNARERVPRTARKVGAVHDQFIKLGPTSVPKPSNRPVATSAEANNAKHVQNNSVKSKPSNRLLATSTGANSAKYVQNNSVKLGRPSLDRQLGKPKLRRNTSSTSPSTTSPSSSDSDVDFPAKAIKSNFRAKPGRVAKSKILVDVSSTSSDSSQDQVRVNHVPNTRGNSWTITEVKMNDIDCWHQELVHLRELVKERYDYQKHVQELEEKIVRLEAVNIKLINENESLVQTVKHLVGEKPLQPSKSAVNMKLENESLVQTVRHSVDEKPLQPSKSAQTATKIKEEDEDCICID